MKIPKKIKCHQYKFEIISNLTYQQLKKLGYGNIVGAMGQDRDKIKRQIYIAKDRSQKFKEVTLIHELYHLSMWYHKIYQSDLIKSKDIEEYIIWRIDKTYHSLLKQC